MKELRQKKLESLMQREISSLIQKRRIKDERIGFVSVTEVRLSSDMESADVYLSAFGEREEVKETWIALRHAANSMQSEVGRNLRLRQTPRLILKDDNRIREGDRIIEIIDQQSTPPQSEES